MKNRPNADPMTSKEPHPGLIYLYNHTMAWRKNGNAEIGWQVEVPKYRRVHKVQRGNGWTCGDYEFEFEFVDEPGVIYTIQYGWALVQETPANIEALRDELKEARLRRWSQARIHRYKNSGEVLAGPSRESPLWAGIAIVSV